MQNSIDFSKIISLHVIPVHIRLDIFSIMDTIIIFIITVWSINDPSIIITVWRVLCHYYQYSH